MSQQVVSELVIESNTSGAADFERAMGSAEASARRGMDAASNFNINLVALGTGAIAAGLAIKGAIDQVVDANKGLADMSALATRVGLSLKDLQGVQFGGRIAGLSDGTINAGLEKSASLLNDASRNANSLSKELEANGVSLRTANGQLISQNQLLQIAGDLVGRARNPQDAIAIAQMLGYTKEWVPLLQQGSGAMKALGDEASKAGAVLDDETVNRAVEFDQKWRKSSVEFSSYMKSALLGLLPIVDDLIDGAAKFIKSIDKSKIQAASDESFKQFRDATGIPDSAGLKIEITQEAKDAFNNFGDSSKSIWEHMRAIASGLAASIQYISEKDVKWYAGTGAGVTDYSGASNAARWQGQADLYGKQASGFLSGANFSGNSIVAARDKEGGNDAVDRAINTLRRHTEQQLADSAAIGQGVGVMAAFRAQAAETAAVQANGGKETAEQARQFAVLKDAAAEAAIALERAKIGESIRFGANTAFLSAGDVAIAQQLKGLYPDVATALGSVEAAQIRVTTANRELATSFQNNGNTALTDFEMGAKSAGDAIKSFEQQFARSILNMANQALILGPISRLLQGLAGGISGGGATLNATPWSFPMLPAAHGHVFASGNVIPFASGGIIGGPTLAPMALMGEAGPEAVVPLRRGRDGNLGVAGGGNSTQISYHIDASGADAGTVEAIKVVLADHARQIAGQRRAMDSAQRFQATGVS